MIIAALVGDPLNGDLMALVAPVVPAKDQRRAGAQCEGGGRRRCKSRPAEKGT